MTSSQNSKQDEFDEILYDEYYRQKLTFFYFIFSRNAFYIIVGLYLFGFHVQNWTINQYLSFLLIALMVGYRYFFKAYKGDEFNVWLISFFGDINLAIKKRTKERYS